MAEKFLVMTSEIRDYVRAHGHNRDPLLAELEAETARLGRIAGMQIDAVQGTFMSILVHAIGARSALEIGTFTGYSALCVARALPADGKLLCCDVNEEWTAIGRRYWERAGVAGKITLKIGPGLTTLRALAPEPAFDFAFIDANKEDYPAYYEETLSRLRPSGLILIDNVVFSGRVLDRSEKGPGIEGIRALNERIVKDTRVEAVMLPMADGLTLVRKK